MTKTKAFVRIFAPVALLLLGGMALYGQSEIDREYRRIGGSEILNVTLGASALEGKLEDLSRDLAYLSSTEVLRRAVDEGSAISVAALAADFSNFALRKRIYDQLRWIDESGMERVRIDLGSGQPAVVAAQHLQDKAGRYYFTDTMKLQPGEIYISPLDLNVEGGEIEIPHKPMIRIATPVTSSRGEARGIVVLNFLGQNVLRAFNEATANVADHAMLVNRDGYWLKSPHAADEWGFMLGHGERTLAARAPAAWERVRATDEGQLRLESGLWTWRKAYPLAAGQRSKTGAEEPYDPRVREVGQPEYMWISLAHLPASVLDEVSAAVWRRLAGAGVALLALLGIGSGWLAWARAAREQAEERLRQANAALEATVLERTGELRAITNELTEAQRIGHIGNWTLDIPSGRLNWSDEVLRIFEVDLMAFDGTYQGFLSTIHPDDIEAVRSAYVSSLADHKPFQIQHRLLMTDGRIKWVLEKCDTHYDASGQPLESKGIVQEITEHKRVEAELRASEQRFRDLVNTTDGIVWEADARTFTFTFISDKAERLLGYPPEDWLEPGFWVEHLHPDDLEWAPDYCASCTGRLEAHDFEYRFIAKDGRSVWLRDLVTVAAEEGQPRWLRGIMIDVTEQKRIEKDLHDAHAMVREVQRISGIGGWSFDCASGKVSWTDETHRIHGTTADFDPSEPARNIGFYHPDDVPIIASAFQAAVEHGRPYDLEMRLIRRDGQTRWIRTVGSPRFVDGKLVSVTGNIMDITERRAAEDEIKALAFYDPLTQLPNRRLLYDRLHMALARCERSKLSGALLFIDLDNFKDVNDSFGHEVGDLLLQEATRRMKHCVREGDTVARLGGDEFVVMLENLEHAPESAKCQITRIAEKIVFELAKDYELAGQRCCSTPSIGIVLFNSTAVAAKTLLKQADEAMYSAKQSGRNAMRFYQASMMS